MLITFEAEITSDGLIRLPEKYKNLADRRVSVILTDDISTETNSQKEKILKYAGIWNGLSDEDLGLEEMHERRKHFFGGRQVDL
ncbi:hypothetical protein [Candidatus Entotheonella palauensis]|uniref:hypothetical protein n=1 Tax=Candidatus Entotheonella palauensis TaxID=93172 RepID=UPI000B7F4896|nr:hypothetical protein [Candidatus Entotheonella palauensis]